MAWPSKIFVATDTLGVYYTSNFVNPTIQPVWTAINTGLATLDCKEFHLDPFHQADRQYVLVYTNTILYRREYEGAWTEILTQADCVALFGSPTNSIDGFCVDPSIDGRLWVTVRGTYPAYPWAGLYLAYSDDYGDNWTAVTPIEINLTIYDFGSPRAYGDNVYCIDRSHAGAHTAIRSSSSKGSLWATETTDGELYICLNPLLPNSIYLNHAASGTERLAIFPMGGTHSELQSSINIRHYESMWFNPDDDKHQRLISQDGRLYVTNNAWATINSPGLITQVPYGIAPWAGDDTDQMLIAVTINHALGSDHCIGALYGEADTTPTGIAGTNPGTPPFTDSIPYTASAICSCGIQAIQLGPGRIYTYAVAMPGYAGNDRGIPIEGDRGAWDAKNYPSRHTNDINTGIHWTLAELLTNPIVDHDHSGDAGDGDQFDADHLLSTGADDGDVLTSDGAGGAAFEPLPALIDHDHSGNAGDGNTFDAANLTSGVSTDGQVLTSDGIGGAAFEDPTGGGGIATDPIWDAKGDLAVGTGADTASKLPVGANGTSLVADSGEATGLKWSVPAGSGDVVGPAGATDGHLAVFDGASGKVIKDGGAVPGGGAADIIMIQVFS